MRRWFYVSVSVVFFAGCGGEELDRYTNPSSAMEPTLHCEIPEIGCTAEYGDVLLVRDFDREPERGDIVVFDMPGSAQAICPGPGGRSVKRIVGLPGEEIEIGAGQLLADGEALSEPYANEGEAGDEFGPVEIPEGEYFVMGDNRYQSCDSREWGTVPRSRIIGQVVAVERPDGRVDIE